MLNMNVKVFNIVVKNCCLKVFPYEYKISTQYKTEPKITCCIQNPDSLKNIMEKWK